MHDNIQTHLFDDDGEIPNNADLPLVIYRDAIAETDDMTQQCVQQFENNRWDDAWVNSVFPYHHYHSTAHEVLGVVSGTANIKFGGENGEIFTVEIGDVVVIPAGVGHKQVTATDDFRVVGAYPFGQDWDLCTVDPDERPKALENIQAVALPDEDPVYGNDNYLLEIWNHE